MNAEERRAARVQMVRASLVRQGADIAAVFLGAATRHVLKAPDAAADPVSVWDLDEEHNPTARDEEATAFYRDAEAQIEVLRAALGEEPDYFYGVVQEAANLALADLGYRVNVVRHH